MNIRDALIGFGVGIAATVIVYAVWPTPKLDDSERQEYLRTIAISEERAAVAEADAAEFARIAVEHQKAADSLKNIPRKTIYKDAINSVRYAPLDSVQDGLLARPDGR